MRLYNLNQATLVSVPRNRKQFKPTSFVPLSESIEAVSINKAPSKRSCSPRRNSLDSSCRHSQDTESTASTQTNDHINQDMVSSSLADSCLLKSKPRPSFQSPLPMMPTSIFGSSLTHRSASPGFRFDIDEGNEILGTPVSSLRRVFSLESPPPSFEVERDDCWYTTPSPQQNDISQRSPFLVKLKRQPLCSNSSASTISSSLASTPVLEAAVKLAGEHGSEKKRSPQPDSMQTSTTDRSAFVHTGGNDHPSKVGDKKNHVEQQYSTGLAPSFDSSFQHAKEGESIVIMIHRKDPITGVCNMRSFFRDERGRWSKSESV